MVESVDAGVTSNLTFPLDISLLNDAKELPVFMMAYSVLYVVVPSCTMINSTV